MDSSQSTMTTIQMSTSRSIHSRSSDDAVSDEAMSDSPNQARQIMNGTPRRKKLREQTKAACMRCKKRKGKCSGERPTCSYCHQRNIDCQYDVPPGSSRRAELQQKLNEANSRSYELGILLNTLQSGSDEEATMVLARLRIGETLDSVLSSVVVSHESMIPDQCNQMKDRNHSIQSLDERTSRQDKLPADCIIDFSHMVPNVDGNQPIDLLVNVNIPTGRKLSSLLQPLFDRYCWATPLSTKDVSKRLKDEALTNASLVHSMQASTMDVSNQVQTMWPQQAVYPSRPGQAPFIRVDPNIGNLFGNLPFSSAIHANYYSEEIQQNQINNLSVPAWAMKVVSSSWDGTADQSILRFYKELKSRFISGVPVDTLFGKHPLVGILIDDDVWERASTLSQWSARMVRSIKMDEEANLTHYASMYHFWMVMRWMVNPTPATYEYMPEWLRPTPYQLFQAHPMLYDFMVWPEMRDLCVKKERMSTDTRWILEMSKTITCGWHTEFDDFFCKNEFTGHLDLTPAAKVYVFRSEFWSVAPSMRGYLKDADSYLRIR